MSQKVTKRKNARVMEVVKAKMGLVFIERLGIGASSKSQVLTAMETSPVRNIINEKMDKKEVKIVDNNRKTMNTSDPAELAKGNI